MKMFRVALLGLTSGATMLFATSAWAGGDLAPERPFSWTGLYAGVHFGRAWTDIDVTNDGPGVHFYNPGQVYSFSNSGWLGGGHVGLQHQFGHWVFGGEVSWSAVNLDDDLTAAGPFTAANKYTTEVDSLFTATVRLGYAWDRWLGYVKGGYASARITTTATEEPAFAHSGNSRERHNGWVIGAGFEHAWTRNVVFGVEYNRVDLDTETHIGFDNTNFSQYNVRVDPDPIHTVTARLSFKFGRDP